MKNKHPRGAALSPQSSTKPPRILEVTEEAELLTFLLAKLTNRNRHNVKTVLKDKLVWVNGKPVTQFNHILKVNDKVEVRTGKAPEEQKYRGLSIVFEDEYIIVIDKAEGVLSIATEKDKDHNAYRILSSHVKKANEHNRIFVVHRLDKDTSGLMMFAKSEKVKNLLQETWGPTTKERTYLAVVERYPKEDKGTISSYLAETKALMVYSTQNPNAGQHAITHYETINSNEDFSLLKVNLETGRKNQIRVHMQDLGTPIIGDEKYGAKQNPIGRLGLHAWVLAFTHPITKQKMYFETKIPKKFLSLF